MEKTSRELGEKLIDLLKDIKEANSPFKVANLSQQALEVVKEWKQAKELEQKTQEPKPEPKDVKEFEDIEFEIPPSVELITKEFGDNQLISSYKKHLLRFRYSEDAQVFCRGILNTFFEKKTPSVFDIDLRNSWMVLMKDFIQILEKKFGLTIKICGNCKNYVTTIARSLGHCKLDESEKGVDAVAVEFGLKCVHKERNWSPKEIPPEKKEEKPFDYR